MIKMIPMRERVDQTVSFSLLDFVEEPVTSSDLHPT
jgi:hypothetical protein